MTVMVLDYYKVKPEFMPEDLQGLGVYVRPGELECVANPDEWELVGRTFHPNRLQTADVRRQRYCLRKLCRRRILK
ncbi:MAG: hypothetical protein ACT4O2_15205 [Beijerinckiaceae bacterium]